MNDAPEDRLFARWCQHGDPQALGALFDATALRLLKLAIHIVGDASEAEDIVQATFLTAIEQRTTVDPARPVMPWLSGVLAHKAQQHRRRASRVVDAERLAQRAVDDPSRPLERRELDGEVARAIDQVGEPLRAVLVLRLRHGMEIADIAHVLERDPGTVRVQLHRGLEKLRGRLPAALVSSLFVGWVAPRGLDALREVVVQKAAAVAVGTSSSLVLGGAIMSKKALMAVAVVLAIAAVVWIQQLPDDAASSRADSTDPLRAAELASVATPSSSTVAPETSIAVPATAVGREATPASATGLRGRVVDAETQEPIAGASLRLFAPREALALDLVREQPDLYELDARGQVNTPNRADWPLLVESSAAARFGRGLLQVYGRPLPREEPIASTRSGGDGSFSIPSGESGGVLEGASPGYATRWRAARDPQELQTLELWREREVHGVVVDQRGTPVAETLDLVLTGTHFRPSAREVPAPTDTDSVSSLVPFERQIVPEGIGAWTARTDGTGRFSVHVGALVVFATIVTPGWGRALRSYDKADGSELTVHCVRVPSFHFVDAESGAPVERVHLIGREMADRYVTWSGEFFAPEGRLELPGDWSYALWHAKETISFVAWDENHAPTEVLVSDLANVTTIEMPMKAGKVDTLEGVVRRNGAPLADAEVALLGRSPLQWSVDEDFLVDAATTSADGRFHLAAAGGAYILRVREDRGPFLENVHYPDRPQVSMVRAIAGREPYFQAVTLPSAETLAIDLDRTSEIEVEIVDTLGVARVEHVVALNAADGRTVIAHTDAHGLARFANLPPGRFGLHVPFVSPKLGSFAGGELREVDLLPSAVERVRIELPAITGPRHARVEARGVRLYSGWRTRYAGEPWQEISADGTLPVDLDAGRFELEISAPDGRRWFPSVPNDAPDGHVIVLDPGSGRYKGRLEREDGTPWVGVAVHAATWGDPTQAPPRVSTVTDAAGEFELAGLMSAQYRLLFQTQVERAVWDDWSNALAGVTYSPSAPPSEAGTQLTIRMAHSAAPVRVHGVVERANGQPLANATLVFECEFPGEAGTLRIGGNQSFLHADERGAFDARLPPAARLTVRVYATTKEPPLLVQEIGPGLGNEPLRLIVP